MTEEGGFLPFPDHGPTGCTDHVDREARRQPGGHPTAEYARHTDQQAKRQTSGHPTAECTGHAAREARHQTGGHPIAECTHHTHRKAKRQPPPGHPRSIPRRKRGPPRGTGHAPGLHVRTRPTPAKGAPGSRLLPHIQDPHPGLPSTGTRDGGEPTTGPGQPQPQAPAHPQSISPASRYPRRKKADHAMQDMRRDVMSSASYPRQWRDPEPPSPTHPGSAPRPVLNGDAGRRRAGSPMPRRPPPLGCGGPVSSGRWPRAPSPCSWR
jgi:hypothetical protein